MLILTFCTAVVILSIKDCRFPSGSPQHNHAPFPRVETVDCGDEAAAWLSDFLGQPCRLIRQSPNFTRDMKKRQSGGTYISTSPVLPGSYLFTLDLSVILHMQGHISGYNNNNPLAVRHFSE